jgi:predicted nucleic acid-binding Zn ribbon protein
VNDDDVGEEARSVYLRLREAFGGVPRTSRRSRGPKLRDADTVPFGPGRDPETMGDMLEGLTKSMGWTTPLAQTDLVAAWKDIAGPETAEHSSPTGISDGVMQVKCDSTAWATQLRLMRTELITRIMREYPDAGVQSIAFSGPGAPTWKRGPRSIPGRGPRDTYG